MGKKINIEKEILSKLYVDDQLTLDEIACKFNCERHFIRRQLDKYEIPIRTKCTDRTKAKIKEKRKDQIIPKWTEERRIMMKEINAKSEKRKQAKEMLKKKNNPEGVKIRVTKAFITKKLHGTENTSNVEEEFYKNLLAENENKTIYRNYKCERYPFHCDFYVLEDDLFIELNAHWTHGGKPYDENDEQCKIQLNDWLEKSKTSQFYKNAIETWTVRDVQKQKIAKENNLNYKVIY